MRQGNEFFNFTSDIHFIDIVDDLRFRGKSWVLIDFLFNVNEGRSRARYKSACNKLGIEDIHYYRHCYTY